MYDLYDCEPILRIPAKVKFKTCICGENPLGKTFIFDCDNHHIIVYHLSKSHIKCDLNRNTLKNNVIIRQIPLDQTKGQLRSMAFNTNCSQLLTIDSNSKIFIIPIQRLIERQNDCLLKEDVVVINSCSLTNPTAIVWWNSLDDYNQTAIVGNDFGEISFINIKTKREIGGTYVQNSVTKLEIIDDRSAVSLLICCKNGNQYHLILEETRSKTSVKSRPESRLPTHDYYYFNCFITSTDEREPIGANNCWNYKPVLIDLFNDNNIQEDNQIIGTTLVYQKPLFLSLCEVLSESEEFGKMMVRLISNKEFDYNLSSFFAKYSFAKKYSTPMSGLILTDRLFFVESPDSCVLISRELSDSRKLAKINPIVQKFHFDGQQVINTFILFKSNANQITNEEFLDSFLVITENCVYLCHQKQSCHQLFHSMVSSIPSNPSDRSLLIRAQRFTSTLGLNMNSLLEKSAILCLEKKEFSSAVRFYQMAKTSQIKRVTDFVSFGYLSETIAYIQVLFSTKCYELEESDRMLFANICVKCFTQQLLQKSVKNEEQKIEKTFKTFLRDCLYYDESLVLKLLVEQGLFHLAFYCAQMRAQLSLLLHYLLDYTSIRSKSLKDFTYERLLETDYKDLLIETTESQTYLNCLTSPQITYSLVLRKDLISKYLRFIVKLLPNLNNNYLQKLATILDPRRPETQLLLNRTLSHLKETYLSSEDIEQQIIQRKDILNLFILITLMILRQNGSVTAFDPKFISIDSLVKDIEKSNKKQLLIETVGLSAGVSHSAYIKNGCVYMWGKSQFGCCGLQTKDFTNITKQISNPTRLDYFKDDLSISVKSVSCGSQHTLVLTDFGIYAFGSSRFGQLGVGKEIILSRNPLIVNELVNKDIVKVECGQYHSLAISSSGLLWTWGWNLFGQLGNGTIEDAHSPQCVENLNQYNIKQAFAGFGHTIALDCEGFVYAFGSGAYGQLGNGCIAKQTIPLRVSLLGEPIDKICTKYFHSLALSRENQTLYMWGTNPQLIRLQANYVRKSRQSHSQNQSSDQLLETVVPKQEHLLPIKIETSHISSRFTKISTGSLHSLLLTADGEVYSFGRGTDGQLGQEKVKEVKSPTKIAGLDGIHVLDITTGSDFSLAVDISGDIWGFGHNSDGQIGPKKTCVNENRSLAEEKNKKISIKTNRRLITFMTKCLECLPIRIPFVDEIESYCCDSLNYSLDISAMKTSTRFSLIGDNINVLSNETSLTFDRKVLALLLAFYRQELDLFSIQNRFKSFKCHQMTAFVYEIQNNFSNAFEFQLEALQLSVPKDSNQFSQFYTKIFLLFMKKSLESIDKSIDIFDIFLKFWTRNGFDFKCFEEFLGNCYKNEIKDSMFGISFFSYLKNNQNISNKFNTSFLLEMVDITIKNISQRPEKLFSYQTDIERITSDIEEISFPAEKLWQNILTYFRCDKRLDSQISLQIEATDEVIVVFNCNHSLALNQMKQTIVPELEKDLQELKTIETKEINSILETYSDWNKDVWDCVCPLCLLNQIKSRISIFD